MLESITYHLIFGKPLILYGGVITLLSLLTTASISFMNRRGIHFIPFKWHPRMAALTILLAVVHGTLGILAYF
jgi:hypothetical protein